MKIKTDRRAFNSRCHWQPGPKASTVRVQVNAGGLAWIRFLSCFCGLPLPCSTFLFTLVSSHKWHVPCDTLTPDALMSEISLQGCLQCLVSLTHEQNRSPFWRLPNPPKNAAGASISSTYDYFCVCLCVCVCGFG
jgi:hypothetical protein